MEHRFTRQELYDRIWSTPMTRVAAQLGTTPRVKLIGPSRRHPDATDRLLDQERVWQSRASAAPASSSSGLSRAFGDGHRCGYGTRTTTRNHTA